MNKSVSPRLIYATALVLAACSLLYELLIAQTLATLAANTVVWYSVTIGVYLAAMGLGALLHEKYVTGNLWGRLFRVELLLSLMGALAVPTLNFAHTGSMLLDLSDFVFLRNVLFFGTAFVLIFLIGILTGFELPLLIDLGNEASAERRVTNRVLASDYSGSLLGGLAFPLLLVPSLSLIVIGLITAAVNLTIALLALRWLLPKSRRPVLRFAVSGTLTLAILMGLVFSQPIEKYFVKNYYFYWDHSEDLKTLFLTQENIEDVFRERSPYQRIDIVLDEEGYRMDKYIDAYSTKYIKKPNQPRNYVTFLNGDYQFASNYEEYYHEFFAHVPIMTNGAVPKRVLVMGAGDGLLIRELIKYKEIETIIHVDLDQKLVALAEEHPVLLGMNEGAFADPRVTTYFDDAFRYIRNSTESFDAIYLDFPAPKDYNLSKLYSREFYHFVRKRLTRDGFVVLDAPGLKHSQIKRQIYTSTIKTAGFGMVKPYISRIEDNNPQAMRMLRRDGYTRDRARGIMADNAQSLRYGYVIARDTWPDRPIYFDPDIELHVLTEKRLLATLTNKVPAEPLDRDMVNSIFRPTFPAEKIWNIRTPW